MAKSRKRTCLSAKKIQEDLPDRNNTKQQKYKRLNRKSRKVDFMKKLGFTLAEVLITLMILGVIAAMTVPTLIQDTQKKEQVVQIKKGLSMINQAVTMDYALNQKYVSEYANTEAVIGMLKERLAVSASGTDYISTSDGLTYYLSPRKNATCGDGPLTVTSDNNGNITSVANLCYTLVIATKPADDVTSFDQAKEKVALKSAADAAGGSPFSGYYAFWVGGDRVIAATNTQEIINTTDLKTMTTANLPSASIEPPAGGDDDDD